MPDNFEELVVIVGPALAKKIMAKMGGRLIRIRKKYIFIEDAYKEEKVFYDTCSIIDGARRLGCTKQYLSNLRFKHKDIIL